MRAQGVSTIMSSKQQRIRLVGAFAALATLALAVSCKGFFVNPTLTGVSVGPQSLTLSVNQTFQMTATGTYDDGTQKNLTSGVAWSSSDPTTVSVGQSSGQVAGLVTGSATITASSGGCAACTGSTTVTVVLTNVTSIVVSPSSNNATVNRRPPTTQQSLSRAPSISATPVRYGPFRIPLGPTRLRISPSALWLAKEKASCHHRPRPCLHTR